jgi:hypothetical protein
LLINAAYNSLVIDAHAMDPDTEPNSIMFYKILNMQFRSGKTARSAPGAFQVDMTTGEIRTSIASYSDYTNGYFDILIEAYDKLGRKDNATVLVSPWNPGNTTNHGTDVRWLCYRGGRVSEVENLGVGEFPAKKLSTVVSFDCMHD